MRAAEEAFESCERAELALSRKKSGRKADSLASPRSAISRSTSSIATLRCAIDSLGSYVFCRFAFLLPPFFPSSLLCATTTGSVATAPMSSRTVLHTLARLFLPSSGSTDAPSACKTTA